jgi:hypothetical protein
MAYVGHPKLFGVVEYTPIINGGKSRRADRGDADEPQHRSLREN